MKKGQNVEWIHSHHLNRRKTGVVLGITGKVKNVRYVSGSHVKVLFKGNKHPSIVPIKELKVIKDV